MSLLHPTMPVYPRFVSDLPLKRPHQLLPCCCQSDDGIVAGAKTPETWFAHEGPYAWGSDLMPGALTMHGLYQVQFPHCNTRRYFFLLSLAIHVIFPSGIFAVRSQFRWQDHPEYCFMTSCKVACQSTRLLLQEMYWNSGILQVQVNGMSRQQLLVIIYSLSPNRLVLKACSAVGK